MPADFVKNSTTAVNPWNGTVYVGIDQVTLDKISVYYYQVPKEACIKISTQNTNMAAGLGLISIEVNGIYSGGSLDSVTTFPYSIHQATLACGTDNNITWVFSLK